MNVCYFYYHFPQNTLCLSSRPLATRLPVPGLPCPTWFTWRYLPTAQLKLLSHRSLCYTQAPDPSGEWTSPPHTLPAPAPALALGTLGMRRTGVSFPPDPSTQHYVHMSL